MNELIRCPVCSFLFNRENVETGDFNEDLSEDPYDDFQDDLATEERFF